MVACNGALLDRENNSFQMTKRTKKENEGNQYMETANFHADTCVLLEEVSTKDIKALRDINDALMMRTRRDAKVHHEPGTVAKSILMLISGILLDSGLENVILFLNVIQQVIYAIVSFIVAATKPLEMAYHVKSLFHPDNKNALLSVNRTTVQTMIPRADRAQLDEFLGKQAIDCKNELKDAGISSGIMLQSVDETHEKTHTKYRNNNQSHVVVGQQNTWETGFTYDGTFDSTSHLFMGMIHKNRKMSNKKRAGIRPWLQRVLDNCKKAREAGFATTLIAGDRAYFIAELFAMATLGKIDPGASCGQKPRVITPVKFTREKDTFKWDYLLDSASKQVFTKEIGLNPYSHPTLKDCCKDAFEKGDNGTFRVPYGCIAMVDEYNAKSNRSLGEIKARARHVQAKIDESGNLLEKTIKKYLANYKKVHGKDGKAPSFGRGLKRKKFKGVDDMTLYHECIAINAEHDRWNEEKACLLKALMFFAISLEPGEDPSEDPSKFIAFARDYHERWGIEIGFKDVKTKFLGEHRSRRPVRRSFYMMVGMMLYNRWQVERGKEARRVLSDFPSKTGIPGESRPWIRRKIEKECDSLPTAVSFLIETWYHAFLSVIKSAIMEKK